MVGQKLGALLGGMFALLVTLGGCDMLGLPDASKQAAAKEAEGKAIGGACRHAGRALEECYALNQKALKAAIYAGWRDMDGYMRDNNISVIQPDPAIIFKPKVEAKSAEKSADKPVGGEAEETATTGKEKKSAEEKKSADKPAGRHSAVAPFVARRPRLV